MAIPAVLASGHALSGQQRASDQEVHPQRAACPQHQPERGGQSLRLEQQMDSLPLRHDDDWYHRSSPLLLDCRNLALRSAKLAVDQQSSMVG